MYEDEAKFCIQLAAKQGATYADARFLDAKSLTLTADDSGVSPQETIETSVGVRVIVGGMWGFAGGHDTSREGCKELTSTAVKIAKASARGSKGKVKLAPAPTVTGNYSNPIRKDPFDISPKNALDLLLSAAKAVREKCPDVKSASASIYSFVENKYIATSEGSQVFQKSTGCGPSVSAVVYQNGKALRRSYPGSFGWNIRMQGYENIEDADLVKNAGTVGEDVKKLVTAKQCPKEKSDIIIYGDLLAIHVHETVGHPTESDRATDTEWDFAGSTFLTPEKLGKFQFGSELTSIAADATIAGGTGSYDFDDELVPGKKVSLIKEGLFSGYQSSRETARALGLQESSGAMRAIYGSRIPLIRMTNINLEPGDWSREEIIKDTKNGILATGAILAIFDQRRRTYIFGGEIGWKIENHEITESVKFPIYYSTSVDLWKNCDAVSKEDWQCFGVSCGKGRPHQSMRVGHFCSTARFRNIPIGEPN